MSKTSQCLCSVLLWVLLNYLEKLCIKFISSDIKSLSQNKNQVLTVLMRWMKLEPIIQSEISQKGKYQYSILLHLYGIQKDGNIHVSMLLSQIIPPSPSPTQSKSLFFTSVSLLLSCIQRCHYHLSKFHTYALTHCIGVSLSDLLLSV